MSLKLKISRRIHPVDKMLFHLHCKLRGARKYETACKYANDSQCIDASGDSSLHLYLTLRCNLKCYFCVNKQYGLTPAFKESWGVDWLQYLNRIYNIKQLHIQGGEPMLHKDFFYIVNGLDDYNVCIFTNLPHKYIDEVSKMKVNNNNIILLISYHPLNDERPVNQFVDDLRRIPKGIKWAVHLIDIPEVSYKLYARAFRKYDIFLERQDVSLTTEHYNIPVTGFKSVYCKSNMATVAPDMSLYRCVGLMLRRTDPVSVYDYNFNPDFEICNFYGLCGQCTTAKEIKR